MICIVKHIEWLGKEVRFDLIFRATRDGWDSTDFHRLCDRVDPTVTVLRNNHDRLLGGYTPLSWGEGSGYRKDDSLTGFVFSLTLMQKCPMKESSKQYSISDTSSTCPKFGGGYDIEIVNRANEDQNDYDMDRRELQFLNTNRYAERICEARDATTYFVRREIEDRFGPDEYFESCV